MMLSLYLLRNPWVLVCIQLVSSLLLESKPKFLMEFVEFGLVLKNCQVWFRQDSFGSVKYLVQVRVTLVQF